MSILGKLALGLLLAAVVGWAQDFTRPPSARVSLLPPPPITLVRGKANRVQLRFRVLPGMHINSNIPKSEFLIPTTLKIDAPTDIVVGKITYPVGGEMSFPFSPDEKLSVYTGEFTVGLLVHPLSTVVPIKYMMRGQLRYQACDNAQCFPPATLPVEFEVKVAKGAPAPHRRNPAQSPNVHN